MATNNFPTPNTDDRPIPFRLAGSLQYTPTVEERRKSEYHLNDPAAREQSQRRALAWVNRYATPRDYAKRNTFTIDSQKIDLQDTSTGNNVRQPCVLYGTR